MSSQTLSPQPEPLDQTPVAPPLEFPDDWTTSRSWERAQTESDTGAPINDAERVVWLEEGEPHRMAFFLNGRTPRARCSCDGWHYRDWCAHVASCWWRWIQGDLSVSHVQTGRDYQSPPAWLALEDSHDRLDALTPKQLDVYLSCQLAGVGVVEFAQQTDRAHSTVSELLSRALQTVEGQS